MAAIGIDFGTTYSGVTIYRNGLAENVTFEGGCDTSESVVLFDGEQEPKCGKNATCVMTTNSANVVFDFKRMIGRRPDDPNLDPLSNNWPFAVHIENGKFKVEVTDQGERKLYTPEEIAGIYLKYLKEMTLRQLKETPIETVVVGVPASYLAAERMATKEACDYAGLPNVTLIKEPVAAILSKSCDLSEEGKHYLVFDFGGGTFDVSIVRIESRVFSVICIDGDSHLGGRDIDNALCDHVRKKFEEHNKIKLELDRENMIRIRLECEKIKRRLSEAEKSDIYISNFHNEIPLKMTITRALFERITESIYQRTLEITRRIMRTANMTHENIDKVLLVGGSTRIPRVKTLLSDEFGAEKISNILHPDLAVMHGAARYADHLCRRERNLFSDRLISDVQPHAIGLKAENGKFCRLIEPNTTLPVSVIRYGSTTRENQSQVTISVYEGTNELAESCHFLGTVTIDGIPNAKPGVPVIRIQMNIDNSGILKVTANLEGHDRKGELELDVSETVNARTFEMS
ncbi:hypothetical protein FBUS_11646 [Fasciolopsis buskii]|uniref:Uncharacterized protein n=1 Tax=Fasciolopsis buskii TaxID=27845 RepID=A0A8E0VFT1_9TREM|nr:hypothetical protein FBUS_11646 [Fasciolopsis buski]